MSSGGLGYPSDYPCTSLLSMELPDHLSLQPALEELLQQIKSINKVYSNYYIILTTYDFHHDLTSSVKVLSQQICYPLGDE